MDGRLARRGARRRGKGGKVNEEKEEKGELVGL
jgi:hypothetical protein